MPFSLIPFALLLVPILEIAAFVVIGGRIGLLWTLALVLVTAMIGSVLLRLQGFRVLNELRMAVDRGAVPGRELGHGAMILAAGILLLTPGFITDALGFMLFVPAIRDRIWRLIASRVVIFKPGEGWQGAKKNTGGRVVELEPDEYERFDDDAAGSGEGAARGKDSPWRSSGN